MNTQEKTQDSEAPAPRHSVDLDLEYRCNYARQSRKAAVKNISLTGACLKTDVPLKPLEKINVFLTVSGRRRKVAAKVIWVGSSSAGVQFQPYNNRDLQIVDDIIYFATEKSTSTKSLMETILSKVA